MEKIKTKRIAEYAVSYAALCIATSFSFTSLSAIAQDTQSNAVEDEVPVEVIEVNALRRAASIQQVPVSVSAFREDLLNNVGI